MPPDLVAVLGGVPTRPIAAPHAVVALWALSLDFVLLVGVAVGVVAVARDRRRH